MTMHVSMSVIESASELMMGISSSPPGEEKYDRSLVLSESWQKPATLKKEQIPGKSDKLNCKSEGMILIADFDVLRFKNSFLKVLH